MHYINLNFQQQLRNYNPHGRAVVLVCTGVVQVSVCLGKSQAGKWQENKLNAMFFCFTFDVFGQTLNCILSNCKALSKWRFKFLFLLCCVDIPTQGYMFSSNYY